MNTSRHSKSVQTVSRKVLVRTTIIAAVLSVNLSAYAAVDWSRAAGNPGDISVGANWTGGSVPTNLDALINNGGIATTSISTSSTFLTLGLGTLPGASGTIQQAGGTITSTGKMVVGDTGGSGSLYSISAGTLSAGFGVTPGEMFVGGGGAGTLSISGSGFVAVKTTLRFGNAGAGAGTLLMSGGTLSMTTSSPAGSIFIGDDAVGNAIISGGTIQARVLMVGASTNGSGHVTQTGGIINVTQKLVISELKPDIGALQHASDYTMSGGTITVGTEMYVGAHAPATFNLSGASTITVAGAFHIASAAAADDPPAGNGTLNMNGGTLNVTGANAHITVADGGLGTFNFSNGAVTTKFYNVGQNPGAVGTVNQTGGSATALYSFVVGETSHGNNLYDLSGGSVAVQQDVLVPGTGEMYIGSQDGTGTIKIRGTGSLSVAGSAHMGAAASSTGTMNVSGGTVTLGTNALGSAVCIVGDNGTGTLLVSGGVLNTPLMSLGQNATALGTGTQTGGLVSIASNLSIGEASANANVYDISAGSLTVGSAIFLGTTGSGSLRISGSAIVSTNAIQNATTGSGTITVTGGSLTSQTTHNVGLYTQSGGTTSLGVIDSAGQMQISGGTMTAASIAQATLALSGNAKVNVVAGGGTSGTSAINTLTVVGTSKLDLADHDLVVDYTTTSPLATIKALIISGYANGAWNGNGINSSSAATAFASAHKMALGYGEASATGFANANFSGKAIDADAVLVKYTFAGDANLDGTVDSLDFTALSANYGGSGKSWIQGDFDYSGKVNTLDFNLLAGNFGQVLPGPTLGSVVPEPASLSVIGLAGIALMRRRR